MSNGQMEPVMLMDKGFNPQQEMEAAPVILPNAEKVEAFIAATRGAGIVKTTDESVTLKQNQTGAFFIQTGKTRKDIYLDLNLQAAVGSEFTSVSDRMQAQFERGRLEDVVSYLMKGKGTRLAAFTEQSTARDLLGISIPELKWADTVETVVGREGLPPIVDVKDLNAVRQRLAQTFAASVDEQTIDLDLKNEPSEELTDHLPAEQSEAQVVESSTSDIVQSPDDAVPTIPAGATEVALTPDIKPTVQKPEAHRVRFKAERNIAQFLHEAGLAQQVMGNESFHLRIENEPYLPLVIEAHTVGDDRQLYLTHYREQNSDLIHDGEMVFGIKESGHLRFREAAVQNALTGGEMRDYDREFADIFSKNILEQGFALEAVKQQAAETQIEQDLEPAPQSLQTVEAVETATILPQVSEATTSQHEALEIAQVSTPRELVEKAQRAAGYIGSTELGDILAAVLSTQSSRLQSIQIPAPLQAQVQTAIGLARNKQQSEFAAEILPMAQRLLENAVKAGLTRSSNTDKGRVTGFEGQNYSVRCRENGEKKEFKILCHKTDGLIYAVNGEPQKSQGLLKSDKATFVRYASMTSAQLNQAVRVKQTAVKAGLEL
jgi:hypothetical protein